MLRKLATRLTYANVMSTLAVVLALGGAGAYAANTIRSEDIVDGEVKERDLADDAVTGPKIRTDAVARPEIAKNSILTEDINDGSVTFPDLAVGAARPVVARARGNSSQAATSTDTLYPLTGNAWTQAADESDLLFGQITFTYPPSCESANTLGVKTHLDQGPPGRDASDLLLANTIYLQAGFSTVRTVPLFIIAINNERPFPLILFEPGASTPRKLIVEINGDSCPGNQGYVVSSIKINVAAIR